MTTLHSKIDRIFFDNYNKLHDNIFESEFKAAKEATNAILKEVYEEMEKIIGEDERTIDVSELPGGERRKNTYTTAFQQGRNQLRAELKSNLKLLIEEK